MGPQDLTVAPSLGGQPASTGRDADRRRRDSGISSLAVVSEGVFEAVSPRKQVRFPGNRAMSRQPRDRVTIDLRGIGPELHARAAAQGKPVAAIVRVAVIAMLEVRALPVGLTSNPEPTDSRTVKVTLRVGAAHAARLAYRARLAEVSQGAYLAALLDGISATPRPADHGDAIAALADSTQKVAAMSADIRALIRLIQAANSDQARSYRAGLISLAQDMQMHLQVASRLMARMTSRARASASTVPT